MLILTLTILAKRKRGLSELLSLLVNQRWLVSRRKVHFSAKEEQALCSSYSKVKTSLEHPKCSKDLKNTFGKYRKFS